MLPEELVPPAIGIVSWELSMTEVMMSNTKLFLSTLHNLNASNQGKGGLKVQICSNNAPAFFYLFLFPRRGLSIVLIDL